MKTRHRTQKKKNVLSLAILMATAPSLIASNARAERLMPTGLYSEAKLNGAAASAPVAVTSATVVPKPTAAAPTTVTGEVKHWVKSKLNVLKSFWGDDSAKPMVAVPAKTAAPVAAAGTQPEAKTAAPAAASAQQQVSAPPAQAMAPAAKPLERGLRAPAQAVAQDRGPLDIPGLKRTASGVASYDLATGPTVPRLQIEKEERVSVSNYALEDRLDKVMKERVVGPLLTPELIGAKEFKAMLALRVARAGSVEKVKDPVYGFKGKVSRTAFDRIVLELKPELELKLAKFKPLTPDETRFLSALLLYQQGGQCSSAVGLFHKLSKSKGWEAESNYFLASCSKQMGLLTDFHERAARVLETQDTHYSPLIMAQLSTEVPYEIQDRLGQALLKVAANEKVMSELKPEVKANIAYLLADFGVTSERFKTALLWAKQVPETHPKYLKAQFLQALAEYQAGSKEEAAKIQERIVNDKSTDKARLEFQALVALNAGRMQFQEANFKNAADNFQKVYKDHPLWLQSLTERGWAQLMDGDFEGAIGNMYSIQSPFFSAVYKPESYVIRTIGYLNLCQYGDAYKTLSILEHDYRPQLDKIDAYTKRSTTKGAYYQTVKSFFSAVKDQKEVDGLPMSIVREMARHRDFTNLQKSLNRQVDERPNYAKMDFEVEKQLKSAQTFVNNQRKYADDLRKKITGGMKRPDLSQSVSQWRSELEQSLEKLNDGFFRVDLYQEAKLGMDEYRREVVGGADVRLVTMRTNIEKTLSNRLLKMKVELARILENNELLRYEVFAGSGENIRYQVAGGETPNRVSATVVPKSKSLQWDFDGEYWEDEIGHYRSSLKNNCPHKDGQQRATASLGQ